MIKHLGIIVFAYLFGSIPWGLVLTGIFTSVDIRSHGSGNIGATNVKRLTGPVLGIITLICDMIKGAFPVYLALTITVPDTVTGAFCISFVAFSAFAGHLYPVYMKFKNGGKGVATAAGAFAVISPLAFFIVVLVFIMIVCWTNRVSAASLAAVTALPVVIWKATGSGMITGCSIIIATLIYFRHIDNIKRLLSGTEPTIS